MAETFLIWKPILIAALGGMIPSVIWLWFWLKEDKDSPEPNGLIALSFIGGMAIVYFVLPFQKLIASSITQIMSVVDIITLGISALPPSELTVRTIFWAFVEESAKYIVVFFIAFRSKFFDEPLDAVIYLITVALGFAAMENSLYIFKDIADGSNSVLLNGNMRFLGATIVHTVSSAVLGVAIALSFYMSWYIRGIMAFVGIATATLLHTHFNLSIMGSTGTFSALLVFSQFWGAVIAIIILISLIKYLSRHKKQTT